MSNELFNFKDENAPFSEKLRPDVLEDFIGQTNIVGEGTLLRKMVETKKLSSFILWGPPGCGKTTIANIISKQTDARWKSFSAVISGIKEVKEIMEEASLNLKMTGKKTVLFVDEIHRFNKAQQDAFLPYVENGSIILIGATTENPSFSIISPLISRMRVFILKRLSDEETLVLLERALVKLKEKENLSIEIEECDKKRIVKIASGDARRCYGILEMAVKISKKDENGFVITKDTIEKVIQGRLPSYDKKNDLHYEYISALHKSMRNSDVNAALYYATKMFESGEDPLYIVRRVIQFSSEDIGLADSQALIIACAARETVAALGMPEAKFAILQAVAYCSLAPKSNSLLEAYSKIKEDIENNPDVDIPMQIRNAPTDFMKEVGYGEGYKYAHDNQIPVTPMQCLPDVFKERVYYNPKEIGFEKILKERIKKIDEIKKTQI